MFKVALINPPVKDNKKWVREGRCQQLDIWGVPFPPLSLAYICSILNSEQIASRIFDSAGEKNFQDLIKKIETYQPDFIIMATATPTIESDGNWFAESLKQIIPKIKIAVIGIHVTALPAETLNKYKFFDYVIIGEPEFTTRELVTASRENRDLSEIRGIAFRKDDKIIKTENRGFIKNLDDLSFPLWNGIDWNNYLMPIKNTPFSLVEIERGCSFSCRFCNAWSYHGKLLRRRSADKIVEEINWYLKQNMHDFLFWAESLTMDHSYLNVLLDKIINNNLDKQIRWVCNSRTDNINEQILAKMKRAGCWQIAFGLEFGNQAILDKTGKGGVTIEKNAEAIRLADEVGMVVDGHFILGYPGENEKTMQDTINFACKLPLTFAHFYCAAPFPGSELFTETLENGWLNKKDIYKISQSDYLMNPPGLSPKIVNAYIKKAYRKFYLRSKTIKKIIRIPKSFRQWQNLIPLGFKMLATLK